MRMRCRLGANRKLVSFGHSNLDRIVSRAERAHGDSTEGMNSQTEERKDIFWVNTRDFVGLQGLKASIAML